MSNFRIMKKALVQYFGGEQYSKQFIIPRISSTAFDYIKITPIIRTKMARNWISSTFPLVGNEKQSIIDGIRNRDKIDNKKVSSLYVEVFNKNRKRTEQMTYNYFKENIAGNSPTFYQNSDYYDNLYVEVNMSLYNALTETARKKVDDIIESMEENNPPTGGKARKTRSKKSRKIRVKKYRKSKQVRIKKFKKTNKNKKITKRFRKTNKSRKVRR